MKVQFQLESFLLQKRYRKMSLHSPRWILMGNSEVHVVKPVRLKQERYIVELPSLAFLLLSQTISMFLDMHHSLLFRS